MGAWESDPFGNDTAGDWKYDLEDKGFPHIIETLKKVVEAGAEYLEAPDAEEAIAAADTLARLRGHFYVKNSYTESVDTWVARNPMTPPEESIQMALDALTRIKGGESELKELWEEGDGSEWLKHISDLESRLTN